MTLEDYNYFTSWCSVICLIGCFTFSFFDYNARVNIFSIVTILLIFFEILVSFSIPCYNIFLKALSALHKTDLLL